MRRLTATYIAVLALGIGLGCAPMLALAQESKAAATQETKAKTCRMEQQCRWENFKKICTYVKVCR